MAERLTERFSNGQAAVAGCGNNCKYDYKYCDDNFAGDCPALTEIYEKLAHYEDLEEQGRLIVLPDGMNLRKLFDILDNYSPACPSDYNLTNRCKISCFECWLAALKGAEHDT